MDDQASAATRRSFPLLSGVILTLIWCALPALTLWLSGNVTTAGQVGDAFNIVNSFFSGAALMGVLYTLRTQKIESEERDKQIRDEQQHAARQLQQAILSTRLQSARVLMEDYRRSLKELRPDIRLVPTVPSRLRSLQKDISSQPAGLTRDGSEEASSVIEELILLHEEVLHIRKLLMEEQNG